MLSVNNGRIARKPSPIFYSRYNLGRSVKDIYFIWHDLLHEWLAGYDSTIDELAFVFSYLNNRKQSVPINSSLIQRAGKLWMD